MKGEFYRMEYEAWDEGTDALTLEQEAAYLRLCHQMYRRRGAVPDTPATLARIWRCHPNKARKLLDDLLASGKVSRTPGGLTNTRVTRELHHRETASRHHADAGHTGGIRSGESRRKSMKSLDPPEAFASSKTNQSRVEEKRVEQQLKPPDPPRPPDDHDAMEAALRSAAGLEGNTAPKLFDLSPILGLLDRGYDLATHVLPVLRAKARAGSFGRTWAFYVGAIEDARRTRERPGPVPPRPAPLDPAVIASGHRRKVRRWQEEPTTWSPTWGPEPGKPDCLIPAEILAEFGIKAREAA